MPVHIRDMVSLDSKHSSVAHHFRQGHFVVHKTHHAFSSIPIDQAHEQNNKCVKGDGGAVGLTENSSQLLRWMVSGPEIARVIQEFESSQEIINRNQSKGPDLRHHEQVKGVQTAFKKQVNALCDTIVEMGNPFTEYSTDLLVLDTRDIVDPRITKTVNEIQAIGKSQYECFVKERLEDRTRSLQEPIKRNKLPLFSCPPQRSLSKERQQIASLKQNCSLFSQLYVSCQVRDGDLDNFIRHENQNSPPSLSQFGKLRFGCKSDLLSCIEKVALLPEETPRVEVVLLDGAAIINMLKPGGSKTFQEYSEQVFLPFVKQQLQQVKRVDIIWDEYIADSLKTTTRTKRGQGVRRRVLPDTRLPGNWEAFLKVSDNKSELLAYLADQAVTIECEFDQQIISTKGTTTLSAPQVDNMSTANPCEHEEADTRLILHAADSAMKCFSKVLIRTVDTDVLVLAIANFGNIKLTEFWVALGTGKHLRYFPVHTIGHFLGPGKAKALSAFHAFTGCDQTSSFANKGKKTAWKVWKVFDEVTPAFQLLGDIPGQDTVDKIMPQLERFVILMYDRTSSCPSVNEARKDLFTHKGRSIDSIQPTFGALVQHTKRVAYQARHCWGQALVAVPDMPSPENWGWVRDESHNWAPHWISLPQASKCCQELLKCGCNVEKGCRTRCKCVRAEMLCTALCRCGGDCDRDYKQGQGQ